MPIRARKRKVKLNYKEGKPEKFVASHVLIGSISTEKLCSEVSCRCGVHRGMVDLVIKALVDTASSYIEEGFSVKFGEFGSFRPSINAKTQEKAEDVNANTVVRKRILFAPGTKFRDMLDHASIEMMNDDSDSGSETNPNDPADHDKTDGKTDGKTDDHDKPNNPDDHSGIPDPDGGIS